ncbi:amidohydrolase family protein [Muriicola sp. Z0-33]|uniref:amidohydrolase family protein n=1 Tax=Muriicola sp. Z0-33 TaxID=2816957 RepID=UPI0022373D9D|nr:amidohydrolase [Muriicola sp. Z0-33]MCW5516422.1 amidohydrolase family protein [Muriicola sp. Z0-33]
MWYYKVNLIKKKCLAICIIASLPCLAAAQEELLLKDFQPVSAYNTSKTEIVTAKYPVIDVHTHPYAKSESEILEWISNMDKAGVEKSILLTYTTGKAFDSIYNLYSKFGERFEIWCGFDYTGYNDKGWSKKAVKELERCFSIGAKGVGELGDKGAGLFYSKPTEAPGMHIDDTRMKPLLAKCGELGMPVSIHVADPYWMYLPMDKHNDGLMNAYTWKIDTSNEDLLLHKELMGTLENAVRDNPGTTFIACHLANCSHDLNIIGKMLDKYPNLFAEIGARYAELAPIPRHAKAFFEKYQDRLLYGTDMGMSSSMYQTTFRILESSDEHFYIKEHFSYHWPLYGLDLSDKVLKKLYNDNAGKIYKN